MSRVKKAPGEKDIVYDRLKDLINEQRTNAATVSNAIGAHKSFLADLLTGRKTTISVNMLKRLAKELNCDVSYLVGETTEPKSQKSGKVRLQGTIMADNWMPPSRDAALLEDAICPINSDYPAIKQKFYKLFMNGNGLGEIEAIVNVVLENPIDGDLAVLQQTNGELIERSIRRVYSSSNGFLLNPTDSKSKAKPIEIPHSYKMPKNMELLGIVANIYYSMSRRPDSFSRKIKKP